MVLPLHKAFRELNPYIRACGAFSNISLCRVIMCEYPCLGAGTLDQKYIKKIDHLRRKYPLRWQHMRAKLLRQPCMWYGMSDAVFVNFIRESCGDLARITPHLNVTF